MMHNSFKDHKLDGVRRPLLRHGVIIFRGQAVPCFVLNISNGGAGLVLANDVTVPFVFDLEIDGERIRRRCLAIWRNDRHMGVSFDMNRLAQAMEQAEKQAARRAEAEAAGELSAPASKAV
jgi:hypothetical protein